MFADVTDEMTIAQEEVRGLRMIVSSFTAEPAALHGAAPGWRLRIAAQRSYMCLTPALPLCCRSLAPCSPSSSITPPRRCVFVL